MDRANSFTIELIKYPSSELGALLDSITGEGSKGLQPELKKYDILWLENVPKELFNFVEYFNWLSGSVKLWLDEKPVTHLNYRTPIYVGEGEEMVLDHYDYINFEDVTDVPPIVEEELIY